MKIIVKNSSLNFIKSLKSIDVTFENTGYVDTTGNITSSSYGYNSGAISIDKVVKIMYYGFLTSAGYIIAYYNSNIINNDNFIKSVSVLGSDTNAKTYIFDDFSDAIAAGATHFVLSYYNNSHGGEVDYYAKYWVEE